MDRIWNPIPIHTAVIEILTKKGSLNDSDLMRELGNKYSSINFRELNKILMQLEIRGVIRVYRHPKNVKMVELALDK
jgi:hypothetical protein